MGTAIAVLGALVGVGIVVDQLFRLRNWLNKPPPAEKDPEHPDETSAGS